MHVVTFQTVVIVISSSVQSLIFAVKEKKMEQRRIGNWEWGMTNVDYRERGIFKSDNVQYEESFLKV